MINLHMHCHFQDFPGFSFPLRITNNTDIIMKTKRDNFSYQFRPSVWPFLEELRDLMNYQQMVVFGERYGNLLSLLDARVDDKAVQTLL